MDKASLNTSFYNCRLYSLPTNDLSAFVGSLYFCLTELLQNRPYSYHVVNFLLCAFITGLSA